MHIMTKRGSQDNVVTYEHMCDTMEDLAELPPEQSTIGSVAVVLTGTSGAMEVYIANSAHEWGILSAGGGTSGGSNENAAWKFNPRRGFPLIDIDTTSLGKGDASFEEDLRQIIYKSFESLNAEFAEALLTAIENDSVGILGPYFLLTIQYTNGTIITAHGHGFSQNSTPYNYLSKNYFIISTTSIGADIIMTFETDAPSLSSDSVTIAWSMDVETDTYGNSSVVLGECVILSDDECAEMQEKISHITVSFTNEWLSFIPEDLV